MKALARVVLERAIACLDYLAERRRLARLRRYYADRIRDAWRNP